MEQLVAVALAAADDPAAARAAGRARFDYEACRAAGARETALGDAAAVCWHDRDDVHWPSLLHPGAVVWPVCGGSSRAAVAGYEAAIRLAVALGPEHRRHWHVTATAGAVGAAVAAAVAAGLDEDGVADAAGHAVSVAGGSILAPVLRTGTRVFHRLHAAATGAAAARAAAARLGATRVGLEHERGLFAATGAGAPERLLEERPRPAICEVSFRLHAATGFAQAAVEAARRLAPVEAGVDVAVTVPPAALALADDPEPRTDEDAWWSVQYAVAVALLGLDLEDRTLLDDPRVRALLPRVRLETGARTTVAVAGRSAEAEEGREVTDDELVTKWRTLAPGLDPPVHLLSS